ncbi:hypothetical protein [Yinghuangia soli]|uniref:Uncharacterized protein n=1 Tax=Yinghuangia soli TaxID=2908204 RepID=A0AA41U099_9ACTN|nr:hypothetical protein [Yinghuangia soli]MCF2529588.1 hypothetical protein [Yinghuangia soli]
MTGDTELRLAGFLAAEAEEAAFGEAPLTAIGAQSARSARRRRRAVLASVAGAVVTALVVGGISAMNRSEERSPARPAPTVGPPEGTKMPASPDPSLPAPPDGAARLLPAEAADALRWPTRGSLAGDRALLAAAEQRLLAETAVRRGQGTVPTGENEPVAHVWFAGDTPAGRIVAGVVDAPIAGTRGTRTEIRVWAGPSGAPVSALTVVGNVGEPLTDDLTVSRLVPGPDGSWWLLAVAPPGIDGGRVSWRPEYGVHGRAPRQWAQLAVDDGIVLTAAPWRAVTARIVLTRGGVTTAAQPVIEDSRDLGDPSFLPHDPAIDELPQIEWLQRRLELPLGLAPGTLTMENTRPVILNGLPSGDWYAMYTVRLPSGALLVAYLHTFYSPGAPPAHRLLLTAAPAAVAGGDDAGGSSQEMVRNRVWAWYDEGQVVIAAPAAKGQQARLLTGNTVVGETLLDAIGFGRYELPSDIKDKDVEVQVSIAEGVWRPGTAAGGPTHSDPFDLRS